MHATRLAQFDGLKRTVYVSGFSKILAPQWRVSDFAAAPALAHSLMAEGWLTAPGAMFQAERRRGTLMRVNFATAQDARFWQRVGELRGR